MGSRIERVECVAWRGVRGVREWRGEACVRGVCVGGVKWWGDGGGGRLSFVCVHGYV